jgi:hypothetical protein
MEPWRRLLDVAVAASRAIRGGNYVQLATVAVDGSPRVRTVVQRGIIALSDGDGGTRSAFKFVTDLRSQKVEQIQRDARCEMVWWFPQSSEQFRVTGSLQLVGDAFAAPGDADGGAALRAMRAEQWAKLRDASREQFYGAHPGLPLDDRSAAVGEAGLVASTNAAAARAAAGGALPPPPPEFVLMLLVPSAVDYVRLADNSRRIFALDESASGGVAAWIVGDVNP